MLWLIVCGVIAVCLLGAFNRWAQKRVVDAVIAQGLAPQQEISAVCRRIDVAALAAEVTKEGSSLDYDRSRDILSKFLKESSLGAADLMRAQSQVLFDIHKGISFLFLFLFLVNSRICSNYLLNSGRNC